MSNDTSDGIAARQLAARHLSAVFVDSRQIEETPRAGHDPATLARARSIALGVLRHRDALDAMILPQMDRKPPLLGLNILRIAAWEIKCDGIPVHAAIACAVEVAKRAKKTATLKGLINAVGRKLEAATLDPTPQALPKFLKVPFERAYGAEAVAAMEAVYTGTPPVDLSLRDPKDAEAQAEALEADVLPTGSLRLKRRVQISALPGFDEGAFWVQDAAAALPMRALGDVQGARVLDLCAAPGGKTLQLAAAGADVLALDASEQRLARMSENLERMKLSAQVVAADALEWEPDGQFDAILLDAPCSATGTLRRHPELAIIRANANLQPVFALQKDLLRRALGWLKPSGTLVFATCSLLPAEGEDALKKLGLLEAVDPIDPAELKVPPEWISPEGWLRTRPDYWADLGGLDGFFAARLKP